MIHSFALSDVEDRDVDSFAVTVGLTRGVCRDNRGIWTMNPPTPPARQPSMK